MFLTKINSGITRFIKNKEGASAIEYAIIVAMVALVLFTFVTPIGTAITTKFQAILTALGGTLGS